MEKLKNSSLIKELTKEADFEVRVIKDPTPGENMKTIQTSNAAVVNLPGVFRLFVILILNIALL